EEERHVGPRRDDQHESGEREGEEDMRLGHQAHGTPPIWRVTFAGTAAVRNRPGFPLRSVSGTPARMNRTGLLVVLAIGAVIGVLFAAFPELDVKISRLFFEPRERWFALTYYMFVGGNMWVLRLRDATMWIVAALAFAPVAALIVKVLRPTKPMLMSPRSIVF